MACLRFYNNKIVANKYIDTNHRCMSEDVDNDRSRREVLRAASASTVVTGLSSGVVSGRSSGYTTTVPEGKVEELANNRGRDVVEYLTEKSYLNEQFDHNTDTELLIEEQDGSVTRAVIEAERAEHTVSIHISPEQTTYAVIDPKDERDPFVVEDTEGNIDEETHGCTQSGVICTSGTTCGDVQIRAYERIVCLSGRCYRGSEIGCSFHSLSTVRAVN